MKLSLNWLRELVSFAGSASDLEAVLTRAGCKVESTEFRGVSMENVVVAEILASEQHPNADRLSVCQVADGTAHPRQIVCGAKNYRVGDKVPLALPGAVLPGNFKIQASRLRGVESKGMLCSAKELGLAEDSAGLLILPKEPVVGTPISSLYPPDSILDLEITPNRGDWLSHLGIAREVVIFTGELLKWTPPQAPQTTTSASFANIEDAAGCSAYSIRRIRGVRVSASPTWLVSKLEAVGLRTVNNIVDITNYVMFLLGQPLHAFDAAQVSGGIVIRSSREGEIFEALDNQKYNLAGEELVIADAQSVIALAGIMGSAHTGVSASTTDVLLESAIFNAQRIGRTSQRLGISSESSYRLERGVDESSFLAASELATQLICEIAGGKPDAAITVAGNIQREKAKITVRHSMVNRLLGLSLDFHAIFHALERIGLKSLSSSQESSTWEIPHFRRDLSREVDLVEEVARVIGMEVIPEKISAQPVPATNADRNFDFCSTLHQRLIAQGFFEVRTSTLIAKDAYRDFVPDGIRLKNPLGEEQASLRPTLIPGLLSVVQRNWNYGQRSIRIHEIGKIFCQTEPEEVFVLGILMTGAATKTSWRGGEMRSIDLFDLKGVIQNLTGMQQQLRFVKASESPYGSALTLPADSFSLHIFTASGRFLGIAGQFFPARSRSLGISEALLVAELDVRSIQELFETEKRFLEIPRYPTVERDIAMIAPKALRYENIQETLLAFGEPLLVSVRPFDVFIDSTGEKLTSDQKSVAVSLIFRSPERTLTSEEVAAAQERLKKQLVAKLNVKFRE